MSHDIKETKICTQQILPEHRDELINIHKKNISPEHQERLRAAFFTKKIWPKNSKIRIAFLDTGNQIPRTPTQAMTISSNRKLDPLQNEVKDMSVQQAIKKIVRERIKPLVNLDIEFVNNPEKANVRISFNPDGGAWSLVGTDHLHKKTGATMNLGWFDVPTVLHEFGHMLGMIHEHQNPRGENIKWNDSKLFKWAKETQGWSEKTTEQNIIDKYNISSINGSNFDPLSIMLYFFPSDLTTNNKGTEQNLGLSGVDVEWISKMYPKDHGISASDFYKKIYNEDISKSLKQSNRESNTYKNSFQQKSTFNWKYLGIYILFFITFLLTLYSIILIFKNRKSHSRYGR